MKQHVWSDLKSANGHYSPHTLRSLRFSLLWFRWFDLSPSLTPRLHPQAQATTLSHFLNPSPTALCNGPDSSFRKPQPSSRDTARSQLSEAWLTNRPKKKKPSVSMVIRRARPTCTLGATATPADLTSAPIRRRQRRARSRRCTPDATNRREVWDDKLSAATMKTTVVVAILLGVQLAGVVEGFAGRLTYSDGTTAAPQRCRNPTTPRHPFIKRDRYFKPSISSLHVEPSSLSAPANDNVVRSRWGSHHSRTYV
jgi:hypothetical protein